MKHGFQVLDQNNNCVEFFEGATSARRFADYCTTQTLQQHRVQPGLMPSKLAWFPKNMGV